MVSQQKEMKLKDAISITTYTNSKPDFKDTDKMQTSDIMLFQTCITKINSFLIFGWAYSKNRKS